MAALFANGPIALGESKSTVSTGVVERWFTPSHVMQGNSSDVCSSTWQRSSGALGGPRRLTSCLFWAMLHPSGSRCH
jgi:hypothetical protein